MKQNCIRIAYGGVASQAWGAVAESLLSSIITLLVFLFNIDGSSLLRNLYGDSFRRTFSDLEHAWHGGQIVSKAPPSASCGGRGMARRSFGASFW
ncbi:hypothetical protein AFLA_008375 [Aspergillus flavus NRRL3357]|nr:hypothetical protein AFLA_008375 [Aspergillus flavus NRRL3357]